MRKILLLLVLLASASAASQQTFTHIERQLEYLYESPNDSTPHLKHVYIDDSLNNVYIHESYVWDTVSDSWIGYYVKNESIYDSVGNLTAMNIYYRDNKANDWAHQYKHELTNDSDGNIIQELSFVWNEFTDNWREYRKSEFSYDSNGNMISVEDYKWDAEINDFVKYDKSDFSYDSAGNKSLEVDYIWDSELNDWIWENKYAFEYDSAGNETLETRYFWDPELDDWISRSKYSIFYDSVGNEILTIWCSWNSDSSKWINANKFEVFYNTDGTPSYHLFEIWNPVTSTWNNDIMGRPTFDSNGDIVLLEYYNWDTKLEDFVVTLKVFFSRDSYPTSVVDEVADLKLRLYPNPVKYKLFIETDIEYFVTEVFDLTGRKRLTTNEREIDVSFLNPGTYIVRIVDKDGIPVRSEKIIKE